MSHSNASDAHRQDGIRFRFGANFSVIGKMRPESLSSAKAFVPRKGTTRDLAEHIGKGHPWMPAILDEGSKRVQTGANHAECLAIDVDNSDYQRDENGKPVLGADGKGIKIYREDLTLEQALEHPFIKAHAALIIESASSTPKWNKFRAVFLLASPMNGCQNINKANRFLAFQVGSAAADEACKDASRYYFGAPGRKPVLLNGSATLPADFLSQAQQWEQVEQLIKSTDQLLKRTYGKQATPDLELVEKALAKIPPRTAGTGTYGRYIAMIGGVLNTLGAAGARLLEAWDGGRGDWGIPFADKLTSLEKCSNKSATLGSLFAWARQEGFDLSAEMSASLSAMSASVSRGADNVKPLKRKASGEFVSNVSSFQGKENSEDLVTPKEWIQLDNVSSGKERFNPFDYTPQRLGDMATRDAARLSVDPLAIWTYLMSAVASLMGRETELLMDNWAVPNILWGLLIGESGSGKTRAKSLVMKPLDELNQNEYELYQMRKRSYYQALKACKGDDEEPERPRLKKYVFNQATPQAVLVRLADQETNGCLWVRDEIAGLFKGLNQFAKGDSDGLETLLETWDGKGLVVDRVDEEKTYLVPDNRLSVVGGIQPKVLQQVFDLGDPQGVLARFLVAEPEDLPYKRYKGALELSGELPELYEFIESAKWGTLQLDMDADDLWTEIAETLMNEKPPVEAAKPWIRKMAGHVARLSMVIHAIECFYEPSKNRGIVTAETLLKAYSLGQQYRSHFYHMMGVTADEGLSGILASVQELAKASPDGITPRDVTRGKLDRKIKKLADLERISPADFVKKLFAELADKGYGSTEESKRSVKYFINPKIADIADKLPKPSPCKDSSLSAGLLTSADNADITADKGANTLEQLATAWFPGKNVAHNHPKEPPYSSVAQSKGRPAAELRIPVEPTQGTNLPVVRINDPQDRYPGLLRLGENLKCIGLDGELVAAEQLSGNQVLITERIMFGDEAVDEKHVIDHAELVYYGGRKVE